MRKLTIKILLPLLACPLAACGGEEHEVGVPSSLEQIPAVSLPVELQGLDGWEAFVSGTAEQVKEAIALLPAETGLSTTDAYGCTPLLFAIMKSADHEVVSALLSAGAEVRAKGIMEKTSLMYASGGSDLAVVFILLEAGADINAVDLMGATALMYSTNSVNPEVVELLIRSGANVNTRNITGRTALGYAALNDSQLDVVEVLIQAGANLEITTGLGISPLAEFAGGSNAAVVSRLLKAGANVDSAGEYGYTPLMAAAMDSTDPDVISLLLKHGANVHLVSPDGRTAFDYARDNPAISKDKVYLQLNGANSAED